MSFFILILKAETVQDMRSSVSPRESFRLCYLLNELNNFQHSPLTLVTSIRSLQYLRQYLVTIQTSKTFSINSTRHFKYEKHTQKEENDCLMISTFCYISMIRVNISHILHYMR